MHAETPSIGHHLIVDINGVNPQYLRDRDSLMNLLQGALQDAGFHQLETACHEFPGGGFTGVVLLSESHAAIHTYPELEYAALDIFGCGRESNPQAVVDAIIANLQPRDYKVTEVERWATPAQNAVGTRH